MNISEIESDPALTRYGAVLGFAYVVSAAFLFSGDHFASTLSRQFDPVCWPYFESCGDYRGMSNLAIRLSVLALGAGALAAMVAFLMRRARLGYWMLLGVAATHAAMIAQDFRNTQNQYYMLIWTVLAFLFWPRKRVSLHYLILSFYFWAGRLKMNSQWLSGQGLYRKLLFIPESLNPAACAYVIILEMAMIWGLVSRNRAWFWATLAQLFVFHVVSYSQIGAYYPVLMIAILAIYPLARLTPSPTPAGEWGAHWRRLTPIPLTLAAIFAFFQIYPSLVSRDRALSGVGRTFALNMFEARYDCRAIWLERFRDGHSRETDIAEDTTDRLKCEPILYYEKSRTHCRLAMKDPSFQDLDFRMDIARHGAGALRPLIRLADFCSHPPGFNLFLPNSWIIE